MRKARSNSRAKSRNQSQSAAKKKVSTGAAQIVNQKAQDVSEDELPQQKSQSTRKQNSNQKGRRSQSQAQNQTVYDKGTYIAFVDTGDVNEYKIGLLLNDLRDVDDEVLVDVFRPIAPLHFQKEVSKIPIFEYTIICDVSVTQEKVKARAKPEISITKQQHNKILKHLQTTLDKIELEEKGEDEEEEEDDDDEEEEDEEEEEEDEEDKVLEKDDAKTIKARKMIKATKQSQSQRSRSRSAAKSQKSVKSAKKAPKGKEESKKQTAKKGGKGKASQDDEDMSEQDDKSEEIQIDTTSKSKKKAAQSKKKEEELPKVGQKRLRNAKKKNDEESEEPSHMEEGGGSEDESSQPVKKRKVGAGKAKAEKVPKKKVVKRPTEFKKGRWNPDVQLVEVDKYIESPSNDLFLDCCIRCNNKNIIRAAITNNEKLLKAGIAATHKISSLVAYWSPDIKLTSLEIMTMFNEHQLLELLMHPKVHVPAHSNYDAERNVHFGKRVRNPEYLMNFVDSGMVSHMAYGARVRRVQMTRGNRQGNNAFLEYLDNNSNPVAYSQNEYFLKRMMYSSTIQYETFKQIYKLTPNIESYLQSYAYEAVRAGNTEIAHELIMNMAKYPNFGFNQLHADVLGDGNLQDKILKQSVTKKANTNRDITPLHCACINPNPKYLKALLDVGPELNTVDADLRRPVHYAAACKNSEPLQILITAGATLMDVDNQKMNCLHIAALTGRAENARLILQTSPGLLNTRDKKSMNAMAYACKFGHTEVVKVLIEFKAKVNVGCGIQRMPPLCWAAAYGHYDLAEYLLDNKGRTLGKDKFKRTPLILAARNGHTKLASLLLQRGSEWDHKDSSLNTPLHYAAAYGSLDCIDLLIKAGADVNAQNSWKVSPINIAMLKSHTGCVKRLLEEPNVDVNGKDEKGRTLIMLSLFVLDDESHDFVSFLLKKGADPNIADLEGQTSLHYIAKYIPRGIGENGQQDKKQYLKEVGYQKDITKLLISNAADLTIKDNNKRTPFTICLENDNAPLLEFLQDQVSINKEPDLIFAFQSKIFNCDYQKILERIILNDPPTKETINSYDDEGQTPFIAFIRSFTQNYLNLFTQIQNRINQQSFIHGNNRKAYKITNSDLFDKFADQSNFYNYNYNFTQEEKNELTKQFMETIVIQPFIKSLQFLIDQGADPHATVYKVKKYRDLDQQKKIHLQMLAEGKEIPIEKEDPIKKRDEKLEEMAKRKPMKFARAAKASRYNAPSNNYFQAAAPTSTASTNDIYDMIGGKKVLREYSLNGMRNALHYIIEQPNESMVSFLLSLRINADQPDYDERTPFSLLSRKNPFTPEQKSCFDKLLDLEVRIDYPDRTQRTAFLNFYENQSFELAYTMLDLGANVNQMDISGLFALKYALIRRQNNKIQELLDRGANINQIDNKGRNLLHHAINMSSATADATFETEQFLIERGVNINLLDQKHRTPLHYAFVKIQDWSNTTQIDPIETVSSMCGIKGLELDVPDLWQKRPLHYASQRGASICAMYMIARGADKEAKDIYGNTPLGIGIMNKHFNYGILLIQKEASVLPLVFREDHERIKKEWEEAKKKEREQYKIQKKGSKQHMDEDEEMNDVENGKEQYAVPKNKKHQNMFQARKNNPFGNNYYDEEDYDDEYDDEDEAQVYQENIFNQQNAFGVNVYNTAPKKTAYNAFGNNGFGAFGQPAQAAASSSSVTLIYESDKEGVSMFKLSIRGGQQGLAYLMFDNGYDLMHAMQDAMDEKKFMLVLTLLSKNPDDEVIQSTNKKGQNLFHILSMNASSCSFEHLQRIYEALLKRGVNCKAKDIYGRNALHYAVISNSLQLVKLLLTHSDGYNPNEIDKEGHTPLSLCLRGVRVDAQFYNPVFTIENIFYLLVKAGADVNFVYPEEEFKAAFKDEEVDEQYMDDYDSKAKYMTSPLINLVRRNGKNEVLRNNLIGLIEYGAKLNVVDSDGRDAIMHAIMNNNAMVVRILVENKKALNMNLQGQDKTGKSAAHYVVNPVKYGSYENTEILQILHKYGFNLRLKDAQNKEPAYYAAQQESGTLLKEFAKLLGHQDQLEQMNRQLSMVDTHNWPAPKVDFETDSELYMELAQEREHKQAKDKDQKVPVDKTGHFEKSYEVYYENEKPWDVYLTKVDLKNGIYGDYVFYKMQLLYDSNRDLYVVFTRWGRIGETGMNQRTPFNNVDEAKTEFKKIFKQKTGGNNFEELDTFSRVKKKYNLTRINYVTVNIKDYLQPFDYDKCPKSKLSQEIFDLFEEISNVTMYQKAITDFGIDQEVLPFSGVRKESLIEARQVLVEIQECIKEDIEISKEGIKADYDKLQAVKEKISELSSRYYELIPLARYRDQIAPPLNYQHLIKAQFDLIESLTNIEYASKVLLGALYKEKEMNPIDYVYQAMNLLINPLRSEEAEYEVIRQYIENTKQDANNYAYRGFTDTYDIQNIFKIQRKGEAEMIQAYKEVPNHFLLYHGSQLFNFIGILSQGLRIAPPEAPTTGYMFGKGVYFADMFAKSFPYANRGYNEQDSYLLLMCEVVLGKQKEVYQAEYIEKLDPPYHSVKGCGRTGPGYKNTITCPNGVKIPYGKVIEYNENNPEIRNKMHLQHNEYIVYNTSQIRMRYLVQVTKKEILKKKQK